MKTATNLVGNRYGLLTVEHLGERAPSGRVRWACRCDCGARVQVQANNLRSGNTTSCDCESRRKSAERAAVIGRMPNRTKPDDEIGYVAAHDRVRKVKGSASLHDCVDCGGQARDWSLKPDSTKRRQAGGTKNPRCQISPDPDDYEPRCRKCHAALDGYPAAAAATRRRTREAVA